MSKKPKFKIQKSKKKKKDSKKFDLTIILQKRAKVFLTLIEIKCLFGTLWQRAGGETQT